MAKVEEGEGRRMRGGDALTTKEGVDQADE